MYTLCLSVLCICVVLGSAREQSYKTKCCDNIRGFKECKRECRKVWRERKSENKLQLALSLPKVCPSHLVYLWKCLNSSIKGLHLYTHSNLLNRKSCCLLGIDASCRQACFLSTDTRDLQKSCEPNEEESLHRCMERNAASEKCCWPATNRRCQRACQNVFASNKQPNEIKKEAVRKQCKNQNYHVFKCVQNVTNVLKPPDHKCCKFLSFCEADCKKVMASSHTTLEEKMSKLKTTCRLAFYSSIWSCFLINSKPKKVTNVNQQADPHKVDVRLHCCLSAKSEKCFKYCLKTYSEGGRTASDLFKRYCEFDPRESTMLTCIADVSQPCRIGCTGLGFCTNFNRRHTELFRSCTKEKDKAAKSDYKDWLKYKRVEIHLKDTIPVENISTCLPEMWKAVACTLHIQPCHAKSHGSTICRSDCLKILGKCADKEKLGIKTVEKTCNKLSPGDQSACISLKSYLTPSSYTNETNGVTHPCYPNRCSKKDVCEINRDIPEDGHKKFVPFRCTPGCPVDLQSTTVIKNGDFARLPIVQNSKIEGCFKICRCEQGRLSACPRLPSCVKRKSCHDKESKKMYEHHEKFYINCNFCVCFDGEIICSKAQCLPETANNTTGRLRRNHLPNSENITSDLPCRCDAKYEPVCGTNGKTFRSACLARCADSDKIQVVKGQCSSTNPCDPLPCAENEVCAVDRKVCVGSASICPQYLCIPRPRNCTKSSKQLLCDTENNQHYNKCSVHKDKKEVAYGGKCKLSCAMGRQKVCGVDGLTYSSMCALRHARMLLDYEGPCKTVGKYGNEDPTVRCAYIKCPALNPSNCVGVTPPGACCKVCATQLTVLFDEGEVSNTNKIVMDTYQPITQEQVVSRVRRHLSVSQCDIFGFYNTRSDFVLLVKAITKNPTELQFLICIKEAQKIETLINTQSPIFTSDEILSSFRAVSLTSPHLSKTDGSDTVSSFSSSSTRLMLICTFLTIMLSGWR